MSFLKNFFIEEDGQDMVEYGLVVSLVVAGGVAAYAIFKAQVNAAFTALGAAVVAAI
jgi:Flp pilus assembly pilin Flp